MVGVSQELFQTVQLVKPESILSPEFSNGIWNRSLKFHKLVG